MTIGLQEYVPGGSTWNSVDRPPAAPNAVYKAPRPADAIESILRAWKLFTQTAECFADSSQYRAIRDPTTSQARITGPSSLSETLARAIDALSRLDKGWNGFDAIPAKRDSLQAARAVVKQLPKIELTAIATIDSDGDVYFRFGAHGAHAYLTVEPKALHLACLYAERSRNSYLDNVPYDGRGLPKAIELMLMEFSCNFSRQQNEGAANSR